jgi:hypothetical protein
MKAMAKERVAIEYASEIFIYDEEVVRLAILINVDSMRYVSPILKNSKEFINQLLNLGIDLYD